MKNQSSILLFVAGLISSLSATVAAQAAAICDAENLCQINRVLQKDDGSSVAVPYKFKYRPAKNGAPTVIYIPGGPGGSSAHAEVKQLLQVPEDFGVIQTDPMFVGANARSDMDSFKRATTSEQIAKDIAEAAKSVNAKDLIIYGVSYGSVPGTILASDLSKKGTPPRAVILDGSMGRAITNEEAIKPFQIEWTKIEERVGPDTIKSFQQLTDALAKSGQIPPSKLGNILQALMMQRNLDNGSSLLAYVVQLSSRNPQKFVDVMLEISKQVNVPDAADRKWLHGVIGCKEIFPDSSADGDPLLYDGELAGTAVTVDCPKYLGSETVKRYDSKDYQISAPVIYLNGENDPATPLWQAHYHAKNQSNMNRRLILVADAAHGMLNRELKECSSVFFSSLQRNAATATSALAPCVEKRSSNNSPSFLRSVSTVK